MAATKHSIRWVFLFFAFCTALILHLLLFSYAPLIPSITQEMGLSYTQAGLIFSTSILSLAFLRIPWGFVCDRVGLRICLGASIASSGVFSILRGMSPSFEFMLISQALLGAALAGTIPCLTKLVATWFSSKEVGRATGVYVAGFGAGNMAGLGLTPLLLPYAGGWRLIFQGYGGFAFSLGLLWFVVAGFYSPGGRGTEGQKPSAVFKGIAGMVKTKEVWLLSGLYILSTGIYDTVSLWLPEFLLSKGLVLAEAGRVASLLPLGFLVAGLSVGPASDRLGLRKPFLVGLSSICGIFVMLVYFAEGSLSWGSMFIVGIATIGQLTIILTVPAEMPKFSGRVASVAGLVTSVGNLGSFAFPPIVGYILDSTGSFLYAFIILAAFSEIALILSLMMTETGSKVKLQKNQTRERT